MVDLARRGLPLLAHAELCAETPPPEAPATAALARSYARYLASRPRSWEHEAIRMLIGLSRETGCHVHIVHLSSADALPMIEQARSEGLHLFVETCPHYLVFAAEEIPDGDPRFKCAPPIRERENRERLWEGLAAGIDRHDRHRSLARAAGPQASRERRPGPCLGRNRVAPGRAAGSVDGGAASAGSRSTRLQIGWPAGRRSCSGFRARRARSLPGRDADLVVFDPDASFTVQAAALHDRHRLTPYEGRKLFGRVETTYLKGNRVFRSGSFPAPGCGRPLLRTAGRPGG